MQLYKEHTDAIVTEKIDNETLSPLRDMSEIYYRLGKYFEFVSKKCPTLFCDMDIPNDCDYLTILYDDKPTLVHTRKGLSDEDIIKIVMGETENYVGVVRPCPAGLESFCVKEYVTECNIANFYYLGATMARSMHIRCPQIFIFHELQEGAKTGRGNTVFYGKALVSHVEIYEKPRFNEKDTYEALAHELRHCFQIERHYEKYYSNFKSAMTFQQGCRELYHLQPAEIDADAYALRFIQSLTGENYSANTIFPNVNREIERYAKTLDDSLFEPFAGRYR